MPKHNKKINYAEKGQAPYDNGDSNFLVSLMEKTRNHNILQKFKLGDPSKEKLSETNRRCSTGQVMLLTVLVIGGLILGASGIAGLLMMYQIRQSNDITNSAKAIFAADTGLEWELYRMFQNPDYPKPTMTNGASFETTVNGTSTIKSVGTSHRSSRAFELTFE